MAREVITHMYRNSGEFRLIDKIIRWMRIHKLYKITDMCDIIREKDNAVIGRFEVVEGFNPLVKFLSRASDFRDGCNKTVINVRSDNGKIVP